MGAESRQAAVVIEDDDGIRHLVGTVLEQIGLDVVAVGNGLEGVAAVREHAPVVVTVDINMPGIDGFETAKRIRAVSNAYMLMLTARDEEIDALQGLGSGADDFVLKPFRPRELRARIEAMLRRPRNVELPPGLSPEPGAAAEATTTGTISASGSIGTSGGPSLLAHNGITLDPASRIVLDEGAELELTRSEFELLQALLESGRSVRSKSQLALVLRGDAGATGAYVSDADRRGVEVHIGNLRKKLHDDASNPRIVETVRGVGYRLAARRP